MFNLFVFSSTYETYEMHFIIIHFINRNHSFVSQSKLISILVSLVLGIHVPGQNTLGLSCPPALWAIEARAGGVFRGMRGK